MHLILFLCFNIFIEFVKQGPNIYYEKIIIYFTFSFK